MPSQVSSPRSARSLDALADLGPALGVLLFHLSFLTGYGVFRDELYYIACGRHPAWGYVDHPPLVGWTAWAVARVAGESHLALRVVAAVAAALTACVAARIARELGGGSFARVLAGLAAATLPVALSLGSVYSMNALDLLVWAAVFWIVTRALSGADERWWLAFGAVAGLGLLNKISVLFLGFGLLVGLLLARRWGVLRSRWFWAGGALAVLLFLPHLLWQQANGWPTLEFMANARSEKMAALSLHGFLGETLLQTAPAAWLWILGTFWLVFGRGATPWRTLGFAFLVVLALLALTGGKPYYLAAAYSAPLAAGAVALEAWSEGRRGGWRPLIALLIVLTGLALSPFGRPVLPVESYVRYAAALGVAPSTEERHELGRLPQFYADMHGWREMAEAVATVVSALPEAERARACIFGQNYGEAGAMEYFGPALGLPPAISSHNSYALWGPGRCTGELLLVIADRRERLDELFDSVEPGGVFHCRDCMPYENGQTIWIARRLKRPLAEVWPAIRRFI
jgi:hypothetical protein